MTSLTEFRKPSVPSVIPLALDREFRAVVMRLDPPLSLAETRYTIATADAPSPEIRAALTVRIGDLDGWLRPAGPDVAAAELRHLFRMMAHEQADQAKAGELVFGYVRCLMDLPAFALTAACHGFIAGRVGDGKWAPRPGEIRIEAQRIITPIARERREIGAVLGAQIRPENAGRKVDLLALARQAMRTIPEEGLAAECERRGMRVPERQDRLSPEEHIERAASYAAKPWPRLSPTLRGKLGLDKQDAA